MDQNRLNVSAHDSGVFLSGIHWEGTEVQELCQRSGRAWNQDGLHIRRVYQRTRENLVPSVHVVLHLRPCICSRSSFFWQLLLYKPGLSHSQTFRPEPLFPPSSELQAWCRQRKKNTDVGFRTEWPYRGTCHTFPFWIIPHRLSAKKKKNGQRRMCMERFNEGLSTILTCSSVWLCEREWVCECVWEGEIKRECVGFGAHIDLYSVFV